MPRFFLLLAFSTFVACAQVAVAQRCLTELAGGASPEYLAEVASAEDAALYLRQATELLEPSLPVLIGGADTRWLLPGDPAYDDVFYLSSRGLLPLRWQRGELSAGLWLEMLRGLADLYDEYGYDEYRATDTVINPATAPSPPKPLTRAQLIADLSALIDEVVPVLNPVALVASLDSDRSRLGFLAIIRNDSVYPRLIVMRPPQESFDLREGAAQILPALESCAMTLKNFIFAQEQTASRLYLANNDARMVVVETSAVPQEVPHYVPAGEEIGYLRFASPYAQGLTQFSVVFVGPSPGLTTVLRIVPQLRTNMSPREIMRFVLAP
jgi:hypothetical protein